ncbi:CoA transferase subunit A [Trinickia dabaoshanensis]|uniref:CoA transferase subunit A n=1 Tax=Trinickia dabaoshanensis TaxID=564714 RepID=A0A2N7VH52_9BURK|nr:CoA-transferase [Trinickia dabaoshanensis]PMS16476.1 CoA transferase subunit A [Trinickia dabaoshanensis]
MRYPNKVKTIDEALQPLRSGMRLMLGEFVGAGEAACCIEALLASGIGELTLIANTPGLRGGFLKARLFTSGQLAEFIGTHVGTTDESTSAYLTDAVRVAEFFPMGTWAEKVRAGAMGLGGVLIPVGIGILDQPGVFPARGAPKEKLGLDGREFFVERPLTADVSIIKGWRADTFGNVEFRGTSLQNQRDIAMAGRYTIVEVNEIVEVGAIAPERVGCPGVFVDAVVQGLTLDAQHALYKAQWAKLGRLPRDERAAQPA